MTFPWRGRDLPYLDHSYNTTRLNERAVEVPLALDWLAGRPATGLEVGNVLGHYTARGHTVVDLYEDAPGVLPMDLFDVTGEYDWVLAISTLEHVGCDADGVTVRDGGAPLAAVAHLRSLVRPGGAMLATVPFGQHRHLDAAIVGSALGVTREATLVHGEGDEWTVHEGKRLWGPLRERHWPTAVWVGEWEA